MDVEQARHEERLIEVGEWFNNLEKTGKIGTINPDTLNIVFDSLGGSMEVTPEEEKSLKKYTNKASRQGMDAVWGESRMESFDDFCRGWIADFENKDGNLELPKLDQSGRKDSGMKQFFHEVTAIAYGLSYDMKFMEARIKNGKLWQEGRKDERERLITPTSEGKNILISSIPPGFVPALFDWLKSSAK